MSTFQDELLAKLNEYQLMVEEVLGGMDMMISQLENRVETLEKRSGVSVQTATPQQGDVSQIRKEMQQLRIDMQRGFDFLIQRTGPGH